MKKVKLYIAISLDGYIADKNNGVAWLGGDGSDKNNQGSYSNFIKNIDTVILGYNTYNQVITELSPDKWVYEGLKSYVFTSKKLQDTDEIKFVNQDISKFIENLKNNSNNNKDIWLCGGANLINQFIKLDLIDVYYLTIMPIILGDGIKLFDKFEKEKKLSLISTQNYNGIVEVEYSK